MKADVIAVANHKGGVAKTFTAVSLATGLARGGWRTLLVDCDPQGNATTMFDPDDDVEFDLYDLIKDRDTVRKVVRQTRIDSLDLVPSTLAVARLDQELVTMHRREYQLAMALEPLYAEYDAIVLDLPPNLGQVVITALNAADWLVVPTDATKWGGAGSTCSSAGPTSCGRPRSSTRRSSACYSPNTSPKPVRAARSLPAYTRTECRCSTP